ncbi:MAG: hypothetical protein HY361_04130 [Candidatus Aenigmarchaeota archaeon]|nr:hypothetical protein [Candidatus Aenigmarchaeota archaeon]
MVPGRLFGRIPYVVTTPTPNPDMSLSKYLYELTDRQMTILGLAATAYTNGAIADILLLTPQSVREYFNRIYMKMSIQPDGMDSRVVAARTYRFEFPFEVADREAGFVGLNPYDREVLKWLAEGYSNGEIARRMGSTIRKINGYFRRGIYGKMVLPKTIKPDNERVNKRVLAMLLADRV